MIYWKSNSFTFSHSAEEETMARGKNSDLFIFLRLNALFKTKDMKVPVFHQHLLSEQYDFSPLSFDVLNENTIRNG